MNQTTNLSLGKPTGSEVPDVSVLNTNSDTLDTTIAALQTGVAQKVSFTDDQSAALTDDQRARARTNIGAVGAAQAVMATTSQSFDASQQTQARSNIGAAASADLTTLNNNFGTLFLTKTYTYDYSESSLGAGANRTITAAGTGNYTFGASTPSGYTPVSAVLADSGNLTCMISAIRGNASGNGTMLRIRNVGTSAATGTATITIVYMRTAAMTSDS